MEYVPGTAYYLILCCQNMITSWQFISSCDHLSDTQIDDVIKNLPVSNWSYNTTPYLVRIECNRITSMQQINLKANTRIAPSTNDDTNSSIYAKPSERISNVCRCLEYVCLEISKDKNKEVTVEDIGKLISKSFIDLGEQYGVGKSGYKDTIRSNCTRDIKISTKEKLATLVHAFCTNSDMTLQNHLLANTVKSKDKADKALIETTFRKLCVYL